MQDPTIPKFGSPPDQQIDITIGSTDAQLEDQGYTYNQATFTYNQAGVDYGGLYNVDSYLVPNFFNDTAYLLSPAISSIIDIGGTTGQRAQAGMLMGILGLTYPADQVLF